MTQAWQTEKRVTNEPWAFDPKADPAWADPATERWQIGTDQQQLRAVADAIIAGERIEHAEIADLRALIEAVQNHPKAVLQVLETHRVTDNDGRTTEYLRATGIEGPDDSGNRVFTPVSELDEPDYLSFSTLAAAAATRVALRECIVQRAECSGLDTRCTLAAEAHFAHAAFYRASFAERASFTRASFAEGASFYRASFAEGASFFRARFAEGASFDGASFAERANFWLASFAERASFWEARFAEGASFRESSFAEGASFDWASFAEGASFYRASFASAQVFLSATHFQGEVSFEGATMERGFDLGYARFDGPILLTGLTLFRRLEAKQARLAPGARLAMNNLLPLAGGTLEFSQQQIRRVAPPGEACGWFGRLIDRLDAWFARRQNLEQDEILWWGDRVYAGIASWFVMHPRGAFILGEDSRDPDPDKRVKDLNRAASDYELLAANYRNQPATDHDEDWCRWRAHELRRVAWFTESRADFAKAMRPFAVMFCLTDPPEPMDELPSLGQSIGAVFSWISEIIACVVMLVVKDLLLNWFLQRQCLGYLLQTHRIIATVGAVLLGFTALYTLGVGPDTITHNGQVPESITQQVAQDGFAGDAARSEAVLRYWQEPDINIFGLKLDLSALYFSLTTFVTLGYGDFAPIGWFKLATGLEALLGVGLVALFTVAWGRKLVR